jgi:iron complex outermembrane receptor protein
MSKPTTQSKAPSFSSRPLARGVALASGLAASLATGAAFGQESGSGEGLVMEQVVVTARQRSESIQDVPLAVTAFDAEAIQRRGITELEDVARFTAGFAFEDFDGGNASPVIRGQATLRSTAREQTVATFLDGVYMPRSWAVDLGMANVERVEVVKGPQSSRYGRNAFAGAINFVPMKATHELGFNIAGTVGNFDREEFNGGVTVPIIADVLSVRGSYESSEFDGSWKNNHPNTYAGINPGTNGNVGGWDNETYSVDVLFTPLENLTLNASYYGFERREEARAAAWLNTGQGTGNCGPLQVGGNPSLYCGEYPVPASVATMEPRGFGRQADIDVFRVSAEWALSDALTLNYTFGNVDGETKTANTAEADTINCGTILGPPRFPALCNFQGSPSGFIDYDQHELRLSYDNGGKWTGAVGVFYMDGLDQSYSVSINLAPGGTTPIDLRDESYGGFTNLVFRYEDTTTEAQSIFAEVSYAMSERLRLSAEVRYTTEDISTVDVRFEPATPVGEDTFDFITPRFTAEYDVSDSSMFFATVARGAKAGGFNSNAVSDDLVVFDPEFNWTYEVGLKNTLLDGRAIVNLAAFYTTWDDMQINTQDPLGSDFTGALTTNLGDATIWGLEAEGSFLATENLSFNYAASYTDATYDDGTKDELFTAGFLPFFPAPCDGTVCAVDGDLGGNDIERSPDTQVSVGVQWEDRLSARIDYFIRADVAYQSSFFADSINAASAPSRTITNAAIGVNMDKFALRLWARNLLDEEYVSNSLQIIQPFSNNILGTYFGERRTYGLTLSYTY